MSRRGALPSARRRRRAPLRGGVRRRRALAEALRRWWSRGLWALPGVVLTVVAFALAGSHRPEAASGDRDAARGATIYAGRCAGCHGPALRGQPGWTRIDPETGRLPAPPLDQTGHAWMHSDAELSRMIAEGAPLDPPDGYDSGMPAFGRELGARDIGSVVAFVKSRWPPGLRAYESILDPDAAGTPVDRGEWTFPADCGEEPDRTAPAAN